MHWGSAYMAGLGVNALTHDAADPISRQPELKHAAISAEPAKLTWRACGWIRATARRCAPAWPVAGPLRLRGGPAGRRGRRAPATGRGGRDGAALEELLDALELRCPDAAFDDPARGVLRRLRTADGAPAAFLLTGDLRAQDALLAWAGGDAAPASLAALLTGRIEAARKRMVCMQGVDEAAIDAAIAGGQDWNGLQAGLGCGTGCGSCAPEIRARIARLAPAGDRPDAVAARSDCHVRTYAVRAARCSIDSVSARGRDVFSGLLERRVVLRNWAGLAVMMAAAGTAQAGVCDAQFMHDGGTVQLTGTGNLALGADLLCRGYKKQWRQLPRARAGRVARFSYAGLPPGKSKLDYLMTVKNGQATFLKYASAGEAPQPSEGQFDLRMLGLFAYDGKLNAGQKLPGSSFRLKIGGRAGGRPAQHDRAHRPEDGGTAEAGGHGAGQAVLPPDHLHPQFRSHHGFVPGADDSDSRHEHHGH